MSAQDTLFAFVLRNPAAQWQRWRSGTDTSGFLIEPRFTGGFVELYSRGAAHDYDFPVLYIHGRTLRVSDSTWVDSTFTVDPAADGYLALDSRTIGTNRFMVTQGHATRAALYFPIDSLTQDFQRTVTRAELHLFADTNHPYVIRRIGQTNQLNHGVLNDPVWLTQPDSLLSSRLLGYESGVSGYGHWATDDELVMDVSGAVAYWVANPSQNGGLQLLSVDELGSMISCEVFYSAQSEIPSKKPRLYIWYTDTSQ
jgi:hypothetical protein